MESVLEFQNISKYFPGVKALDQVSFQAHSGEVLAFLGENGAGKSTLLKVLNGDYQPTSGKYLLDGVEKHFQSPHEAIEEGISIIYQERQILLELSVAENIYLGRMPVNRFGFIDTRKANEDAAKIIHDFGLPIAPDTKVKDLSIAYQQKAEGKIIIYVSHRMDEIQRITDKVAIFKDGRYVDTVKTGVVPEADMIHMMVGRSLGDIYKDLDRDKTIGDVLLEVKGVSSDYVLENSFVLRKGEVLGFSGLVGAGRTELMRAIIGADAMKTGEVCLEGKKIHNRSPHEAMEHGIVLVPEDRKLQGILANLSISDNINISLLDKNSNRFGFVSRKKEEKVAGDGIRNFKIKTPSPDKKIVELSGGNQQKCIVARWISTNPKVLILDEPTKGIDVGAKSEFYQMICEFAKQGLGVILISSELPEVIGLSDRIIVMKGRKIVGEVSREEATESRLLSLGMIGEVQES